MVKDVVYRTVVSQKWLRSKGKARKASYALRRDLNQLVPVEDLT